MKNHFQTFNFDTSFAIDLAELEKKYLKFQTEFHPDKSSSADISKSIEINEAHKILSDDFLRACHLLQLKNIDILHDEKAVKVDFVTLEEQLELQEKISEISDKNEIAALQQDLKQRFQELILKAVKSYNEENLSQAAQDLIKAKYLQKSLSDLKIRKKEI